ncbi:MAG: ABC transporter ATP-binding protein [Ectothiorhodospiraceae bacterium]|nr:ABC transporter ATP-binding protein [Ectothiorhodospiraceae bacterium]
MSAPLLEVRGLSKSFRGIRAVSNVHFEVAKGEVLGLIGPNGSGKSTLFNCVLGQLRPDAGEVRLNGQDVTGLDPTALSRRGIGRTFQLLQVFPALSVRDNLVLAGQEHRGTMLGRLFMSPDAGQRARADELLDLFRLARLADEPAGSLSYGQQKLLDIAMAFMAEPELVLLDEPAGGVNPTMLGDVESLLRRLNEELGATFVVIEHNMSFVMGLSHRVMVLAQGQVLATGSPDEIRADQRVIEAYLGD